MVFFWGKNMAKTDSLLVTSTFSEVKRHYDLGVEETEKRTTGRGRVGSISFDEADELFRSWIDESKWPYDALMFDPRTFTFIIEKNSRLLSGKLRGRLVPREGGDILGAYTNNELLNFQWDQANQGGTMLSKWSLMDINTRKYGGSFAICKWRYELNDKDKVVYDGPEMKVLNNRDCIPDPVAVDIASCNWFQVREYVTFQDLENVNDAARSKPIYENLKILRERIGNKTLGGGDTRSTNWISRNRTIAGLTVDPYGRDDIFKTIEVVTEYRKDKWITFAPQHGVVLREIDNPYENYEIPITMLRYYRIDDDLYGLSEIEPVKSLQKAINALLCQYIDEVNQNLYTPIAIGPGVKQHTLEWGKGARWIMTNPMTDYRLVQTNSNAASYFNSTYSALVAAMMNAIGESSLGVANVGDFQKTKTATEVNQVTQQRNSRDTSNQTFLAEAIERQMKLWYSMNQKMLFSDPTKQSYIVRIVGKQALEYFQTKGLDSMSLSNEGAVAASQNPDISPQDLMTPTFPVNTGTKKEPTIVPKLSVKENNYAELYVEPSDLLGTYDYVADVESMSINAGDKEKAGRQTAVQTLITNPIVTQMLSAEKVQPKFKELMVAWLEDNGFKDAEKFFTTIPDQPQGGHPQGKPPTVSINFKDLPPDGQSQAAAEAGIQLGQQAGPTVPPSPAVQSFMDLGGGSPQAAGRQAYLGSQPTGGGNVPTTPTG